MSDPEATSPGEASWYIVPNDAGQCEIVSEQTLQEAGKTQPEVPEGVNSTGKGDSASDSSDSPKRWGPFKLQNQAIAKRVGLIRAGKCKPL